ncbi:hypothetical protein [Streptomyces tricolor]|uniref:TPM domain-containing protein n=1 Tax=Streptomyces tricolor TaxID=68277 RepID=A0ABS9JAG9_9ACTN|nr:hypothetical protein [Streptomyces tricolor]MCG0062560.1 hypothetical protein [Streptomyces tricolor]
MTSSLIRARPRRATARIRVRVARAVLGALVGAGWLVLPVMTAEARTPVPVAPVGTVASAAAPQQDGTSAADLVLPLIAGVAALTVAGYGYLRRTRRARTRTTPGTVSAHPPVPAPADSERQARAALRLADDCVRTSREELAFVRELFGEKRTEPFTHALRAAETELSAAFAIWRRYEEGVPEEPGARRQALVGVVGRCAEAGRRLDAEAAALDRLRGLGEEPADGERGVGAALVTAEERFRELAARAVTAQQTLAALRERYAPSAGGPVTGYVEQAKDRLVFATARLNEARQAVDTGDAPRAARQLRAGEGAVVQAGVLVDGVERLAAQLREAARLVPAALTGAEAELAAARRGTGRTSLTTGELHARLAHADGVLAAVREELTAGPYDPLDALRRIVRAAERLDGARSGVLGTAALLVARSSVAGAEEFLAVHRGAVGTEPRARLAEAVRELGAGGLARADAVAREARELAEREVRAHGTPFVGTEGAAAGLAGAVLGGILLAEDPDGGPPAAFGGPETRSRHHL